MSYDFHYDSKRRFASYWHQIREVLQHSPESVLEVGVGSGFVSKYLRDHGVTLTTIDIESDLGADLVGDARDLPFGDKSFDVVTAYEVLEHMPFGDSLIALREMKRVARDVVIISVPDATRSACIQFPIPGIMHVRMMVTIPRLFPKKHVRTKSGHEWEIGKKGYKLSFVKSEIARQGFEIEKTYRVFENSYHRFFILKPR